MSTSNIVLHAGAELVSREQLALVKAPPATRTWHPVAPIRILDTATKLLKENGFEIKREQLATSHNGDRFFGTLDLHNTLGAGVGLSVGLRQSLDQKFPQGFCAGNHVFVCDNLSFRSELMVRRKNTRYGFRDFTSLIFDSIHQLSQFETDERAWIQTLQARVVDNREAESLVLKSGIDNQIVPLAKMKDVVDEWRTPKHDDFQPRTAGSLFNAFTEVLKYLSAKNPNEHAQRTIRLSSLMRNEFALSV